MATTKRQEWLIDYLTRCAEKDPNRWVPMQEIVDAISLDLTYCQGDEYVMNSNPKAHNPCPAVWADKEAINADPSVDAPIMYRDYCLKIAKSAEELEEAYTGDLMRRAKKMLWRLGVAKRKVAKNGQMQFEVGEDGQVSERFVRSIIREACEAVASSLSDQE